MNLVILLILCLISAFSETSHAGDRQAKGQQSFADFARNLLDEVNHPNMSGVKTTPPPRTAPQRVVPEKTFGEFAAWVLLEKASTSQTKRTVVRNPAGPSTPATSPNGAPQSGTSGAPANPAK